MYYTNTHRLLEILSYVLLVVSFVIAIVMMAVGREAEIVVPIVLLISNLSMSACIHLAGVNTWNMPIKIKPGREALVYGDMTSMCVSIMLELSLFSLLFSVLLGAGLTMSIFWMSMGLLFFVTMSCIFFFMRAFFHNA